MRNYLIILTLFACNAIAADRIARAGSDELRISDAPCTNEAVLAQIKDEYHDQFHAASAWVGGKRFAACWVEVDGQALIVFDDTDHGVYPLSAFKRVPEV